MRYQISGKQIDIGEALQTHVKAELGETVEKYAQRPTATNAGFAITIATARHLLSLTAVPLISSREVSRTRMRNPRHFSP